MNVKDGRMTDKLPFDLVTDEEIKKPAAKRASSRPQNYAPQPRSSQIYSPQPRSSQQKIDEAGFYEAAQSPTFSSEEPEINPYTGLPVKRSKAWEKLAQDHRIVWGKPYSEHPSSASRERKEHLSQASFSETRRSEQKLTDPPFYGAAAGGGYPPTYGGPADGAYPPPHYGAAAGGGYPPTYGTSAGAGYPPSYTTERSAQRPYQTAAPKLSFRQRIRKIFFWTKVALILLVLVFIAILAFEWHHGRDPITLIKASRIHERTDIPQALKDQYKRHPAALDYLLHYGENKTLNSFEFPEAGKQNLLNQLSMYDERWADVTYLGQAFALTGSGPVVLTQALANSAERAYLNPYALALELQSSMSDLKQLSAKDTSPEAMIEVASRYAQKVELLDPLQTKQLDRYKTQDSVFLAQLALEIENGEALDSMWVKVLRMDTRQVEMLSPADGGKSLTWPWDRFKDRCIALLALDS